MESIVFWNGGLFYSLCIVSIQFMFKSDFRLWIILYALNPFNCEIMMSNVVFNYSGKWYTVSPTSILLKGTSFLSPFPFSLFLSLLKAWERERERERASYTKWSLLCISHKRFNMRCGHSGKWSHFLFPQVFFEFPQNTKVKKLSGASWIVEEQIP